MKGSKQPIDIFTYDVAVPAVRAERPRRPSSFCTAFADTAKLAFILISSGAFAHNPETLALRYTGKTLPRWPGPAAGRTAKIFNRLATDMGLKFPRQKSVFAVLRQ